MQIHRTDLNLLVVFDCIYTHGSVTRAADTLHLTQPSISHALGRLRDRVGDPLFVRNGQKLAPTPKAKQLIGPVREALQTLESALSTLDEFDPTSAQQTFKIGMRPLMEGAFLPTLFQHLQSKAAGVAVSSVRFNREHLDTELAKGSIDLAVDVFLSLPDSIRRQHLSSARIVVLARKGHPAISSGFIDLEDYMKASHLQVSSRPSGHGAEDLILAREGLTRNVVSRCQQMSTALEMVNDSDLLVTVAESLVNHLYNPEKHQICLAPFQTPEVDTYLYWHRTSESDQGIQWLKQQIIAAYREARVKAIPLLDGE